MWILYQFAYNNHNQIDDKPKQKWILYVILIPFPASQAWGNEDYYASMTDLMITQRLIIQMCHSIQ